MSKNVIKSIIRNRLKISYKYSSVSHEKACIVFLHGLGGNMSVWESARKFFVQTGYSVLLIDLRGHGHSDRPIENRDFSIEEFAGDVREILKKEQKSRIILVGHCLGGMISLQFALTYPEMIISLVLIDSSYKPPTYLEFFIERPWLYRFMFDLIRFSPAFYSLKPVDFSDFKGGEDIDVRRILTDLMHISMRRYLSICDNMSRFSIEKKLKQITCPTLIIHGLKDRIVPIQIARTLHRRIKSSKLSIFPEGNHILIVNNPKEVVQEISSFIEAV